MSAIITSVLLFFWDIAKIGIAIGAAYGAYILYGLKKGFIMISR